ncbi:M56 family metallopeptidase [Flavobacteriaceae bacterium TK19130]|nr:M56 family metallopeptidase [Thermobacterium salinum]
MLFYLLKSAACLTILFLFYKVVLENTSLHVLKRFFLLGSAIAATIIPLVTFTEYVEVTPMVSIPATSYSGAIPISVAEPTPTNYLPYILLSVYLLGVLFFSLRFGRNLWSILRSIRNNAVLKKASILYVLLSQKTTPHSFFNYIFCQKSTYEAGLIPDEVLTHEKAHIHQKHSWDIIFIEVFQILFWFNPLCHFIKRSIRLNHEFLADDAVLKQGAETATYQKILLDFSSRSDMQQLAHAINYSSIKKRFTLMKKQTSKRAAWIKSLLLIPLVALLLYGFSETKQEYVETETTTIVNNDSEVLTIEIKSNDELVINNSVSKLSELESLVRNKNFSATAVTLASEVNVPFAKSVISELVRLESYSGLSVCTSADSKETMLSKADMEEIMSPLGNIAKSEEQASSKQLEIFNRLAKKYNAIPIENRKIGWEDLKKLETIYHKMSDDQKENALPFPECLPKNKISWEVGYAEEFTEGAARNNKLSLVITVNISEIRINGKPTTLEDFAKDLDRVTKSWKPADYAAAEPSILIASTPQNFLKKLDAEFRKTKFSHMKGGMSLLPDPPPAPPKPEKAPDAPTAPAAEPKGSNDRYIPNPPPPPPSPEPLPAPDPAAQIISLAKRGAIFYSGPHEISSEEAIEMVRKGNNISIQVEETDLPRPIVRLNNC